MKSRNFISVLLLLAASSGLSAQSFTVTLEPGTLFGIDGTSLNHSNQASSGISILFAQTSSTRSSLLELFANPSSPDASAFNSLEGLSWTAMSQTSSGSFEFWTTPGWNGASGTAIESSEGTNVLVALFNSPSVSGISPGDAVGLLVSNSVVGGLGQNNYSLGSVTNMTILAGIPGSLQMVSAVPEPSTYAALAGLVALGAVMLRRRRA
ncbi:MAG: PEP-CTERM sorting domain-containing protein [Puniceicoccaceae bacterium]|nr:MAG: PEP-CTERM sorting domain-containing protein [Puniceicoccaceae bacterium]